MCLHETANACGITVVTVPTVLNRYTYGPFGESAALTGTTHGYTGQRYDSETGLYYCKMRQYSSKLGRFLQTDPIGMAGGINLYAYVGNSPLRASDPMGLAADGGGNNGGGDGIWGGYSGGSYHGGGDGWETYDSGAYSPTAFAGSTIYYTPNGYDVEFNAKGEKITTSHYVRDYVWDTSHNGVFIREDTQKWRLPSISTGYEGWWQPGMPFGVGPGYDANKDFFALSATDGWRANFMIANRDLIHRHSYDQDFNDRFGNAFRHASAAALLIYYGFSLDQVMYLGFYNEEYESLRGSGHFTDSAADIALNGIGAKYALAHKGESFYTLLTGLANHLVNLLGG